MSLCSDGAAPCGPAAPSHLGGRNLPATTARCWGGVSSPGRVGFFDENKNEKTKMRHIQPEICENQRGMSVWHR